MPIKKFRASNLCYLSDRVNSGDVILSLYIRSMEKFNKVQLHSDGKLLLEHNITDTYEYCVNVPREDRIWLTLNCECAVDIIILTNSKKREGDLIAAL